MTHRIDHQTTVSKGNNLRFWLVEQDMDLLFPKVFIGISLYAKRKVRFLDRLKIGLLYIFMSQDANPYDMHHLPHEDALRLRGLLDHYEMLSLAEMPSVPQVREPV